MKPRTLWSKTPIFRSEANVVALESACHAYNPMSKLEFSEGGLVNTSFRHRVKNSGKVPNFGAKSNHHNTNTFKKSESRNESETATYIKTHTAHFVTKSLFKVTPLELAFLKDIYDYDERKK